MNHSQGRDSNSLPPLVRGVGVPDEKVKGEKDKEGMEEEDQKNAQYLSANCVIFTYYTGDISKVVDDHFTKALSQSNDRGEQTHCEKFLQLFLPLFRFCPIVSKKFTTILLGQ